MFGNLKNIKVKETLWINLFRGVAAGVIWMIVMLIVHPPEMNFWLAFLYPLVMPLSLVTVIPICWFFFNLLISLGVPFMGLGHVILSLLIVPGDPILFFFHKYKPELVPIETYNFITWNPYIMVLRGDDQVLMPETAPVIDNKVTCPFKGRILADKDTTVLGFNWPAKETIFKIHEDWKVSTPKDFSLGWIDVNGGIHKGRPFGEIDPKAILSGEVIAKVVGDSCYIGNDKIGQMVKW